MADLLNKQGPSLTLGQELIRAIPYFIASIKYNLTGRNAMGKVERDQNISASITILTVLANTCVGLDYAKHVSSNYEDEVVKQLETIKGESLSIQRLKQ